MPFLRPALPRSDPQRGRDVSHVTVRVSGSSDREVVTARSFATGFVFDPYDVPGMRLGASYWRVVMNNRILAPAYQELLKPESPFSYLVVRDDPSTQDQERGWSGRLRSINLARLN